MKTLSTLLVVSLLPGLANATDGCDFDAPLVIERLFAQSAVKQKLGFVPFTIRSLVATSLLGEKCPHGIPTGRGACCWACATGHGSTTVAPRDGQAMQAALERVAVTALNQKALNTNFEMLMKHKQSRATLELIEYLIIKTDNQDKFSKTLAREIANRGERYNLALASTVLQVFPEELNDPWHFAKVAKGMQDWELIKGVVAARGKGAARMSDDELIKFSLTRLVARNYRLENKPFANAVVVGATLAAVRATGAQGQKLHITVPPIKTDSIPPGGWPK